MLGTARYKADVNLLADFRRGSFGYAFSFAAISCMMSFDEAIALSCGKDPTRRIFASEVLLSTIPPPQLQPYEGERQENNLDALAKETDITAKKSLYNTIRSRLVSRAEFPRHPIKH